MLGRVREARARPFDWLWTRYRERFVSNDGRVIDTGQGNRSHSEGQGWGLLFASSADDRQTFERILAFTLDRLRRDDSPLHRWLWLPDQANPTPDPNNATDGDIYIAWASLRAAERWRSADMRRLGLEIVQAVEQRLVRRHRDHLFLLPGLDGFEHDDRYVLNPSYGVMPAFGLFQKYADSGLWGRIKSSHSVLMTVARFGRFGLPPDWLALDRKSPRLRVFLEPERPPRFSYDAVRTPLLLAWGGDARHPSVRAAISFWRSVNPQPAWIDLTTDQRSPYPANPGFRAILSLLLAAQPNASSRAVRIARDPSDDYYSASLRLLVALAAEALNLDVVLDDDA